MFSNTPTNNKTPSELVSNKTKESFDYAKKYAESIIDEWFTTGKFQSRQSYFHKCRSFATGDHDMKWFRKKICGALGEKYYKFLNVDFENGLKIFPVMLSLVENGIEEDFFRPIARAIDPTAVKERKQRIDSKKQLYYGKDVLQSIKAQTGIEIAPEEAIPETLEDIEIDEQLNQKAKIEKAQELLIDTILKENKFTEIKKRVTTDMVRYGLLVGKVWTNATTGIKVEYVNPEYWGHDYTEDPYFRDCKYFFEIKNLSIAEVLKLSEIDLTEEDLKQSIQDGEIGNWNYQNIFVNPTNISSATERLQCVFFTHKTFHTDTYKVKTDNLDNVVDIELDETFNPIYNTKTKALKDFYETWYEGVMILGYKNKVISYKKSQNQVSIDGNILPPYVANAPMMEKGKLKSITYNAIPSFMRLQEADLKIQELTDSLKGNLTRMNLQNVNSKIAGSPTKEEIEDAVANYKLARLVISKRNFDEDGNPIGDPIMEMPEAVNPALGVAFQVYQFHFNQFENSMGLNSISDGNQVNPKTLVGAIQFYQLSTNKKIKHWLDASLYFNLNICELINTRLTQLFNHSKELKERYINIVGADDVDAIQSLEKLDSHYFGIYMDIIPTQEEVMELKQILTELVQRQIINYSTYLTIKDIKNIGLARFILKNEEKKSLKRMQDEKMQNINAQANAQAEANMKLAEVKGEKEKEVAFEKTQNELTLMKAEYFYKTNYLKEQSLSQIAIDNNDINGRLQLEGANNQKRLDEKLVIKEKEKENAIIRQNASAKNQSELIDQRKYGTKPSFANNEEYDTQREVDIPDFNFIPFEQSQGQI